MFFKLSIKSQEMWVKIWTYHIKNDNKIWTCHQIKFSRTANHHHARILSTNDCPNHLPPSHHHFFSFSSSRLSQSFFLTSRYSRQQRQKNVKSTKKYFPLFNEFSLGFFFRRKTPQYETRKNLHPCCFSFIVFWCVLSGKIKNITCNQMGIFSIYGCDTKKNVAMNRMSDGNQNVTRWKFAIKVFVMLAQGGLFLRK